MVRSSGVTPGCRSCTERKTAPISARYPFSTKSVAVRNKTARTGSLMLCVARSGAT